MEHIHMEHFEVEKEKFDHFLAGDGEVWFDFNDGEFITKEEVIQALEDNNCETEEDKKDYCREFGLEASYAELDKDLDYFEDGDYELDYLIIGNTVVINIARKY